MRPLKQLFLAVGMMVLAGCSPDGDLPVVRRDAGRDAHSADRGVIDPNTDPPLDDDGGTGGDVQSAYDTSSTGDGCATPARERVADQCGATEICNNGIDDNCDAHVDENCPCVPGTVQDCFLGPPGSRGVGACHDGSQRCEGSGEFGTWSACAGGISPTAETCDGIDNDCNGCSDEDLCCTGDLTCPSAGDPRIPDGAPFADYPLHGAMFFPGAAQSWHWEIQGGPCDTVLPRPTFELTGADSADATFHPTLSGDYTVTVTVTRPDGTTAQCVFIVHIAGPGLRVELCWDTSTTVDLDLYLHSPRNSNPWYAGSTTDDVTQDSCNWSNCEAVIRGSLGRTSWGYANTPLEGCVHGPHGGDWAGQGSCSNPRLDIDNNLMKSSGTPENINVDNPHNSDRFRVMVENFTGEAARPIVNVYCGGHLRATIGAPPDALPDFTGSSGQYSLGAMWRAADVTVHVDGSGATTDCDVAPLHAPGATTGFNVTRNNASF